MGVIVISLGTPRSAGEIFGRTWEHLGALATSLRALTTSLEAHQLTVQQSGKATSSLGMLLVRLAIIATTYHSIIFITHVFSLYSYL
jgi:hypothetical protein